MTKKRYEMKTTCPQCGCSELTVLSHDEMMKKFGHVPNVELECSECMSKFTKKMKDVCAEWDKECPMPS